MKTLQTIVTFLILIVISSCKKADASATEALPISSFDSPFPKNNKKLSNILGNILTIKSGSDTLFLKITSTKEDNLILNDKTGDTLFFGSICKYRDLYFFNRKVNDTSYYMSAIKIKGNLIYGLTNCWLQFHEVDNKIINGNNKKLIKYMDSDTTIIRLHPDKKELKNLFNSIISTFVPDTILNYNKSYFEVLDKKESVTDLEQDENNNELKVYPNPATDFINVELKRKSNSLFQLSDLNGRTVLKGQLNELVNKIDVNNQNAGIYLLTIINLEKNETETKKIAIK